MQQRRPRRGRTCELCRLTVKSLDYKDIERLEQYVREGWVADSDQAVVEALRRFLDSHRPELMERQILDDTERGLHGRD